MSENPFGKLPAQEQGERKDPRQEAADALFEATAPYRAMEEEGFSEKMHEQEAAAMEALLAHEVSKALGEAYEVGKEDENFYLARRSRTEFSEFDPKAELGVFAEVRQDLPSGRVTVDFDVKAMSKNHDELQRRYFDAPIGGHVRIDLRASPEAVQKAYEKLETEYAKELAEYQRTGAIYETLSRWISTRASKRLGTEAWDEQPLLEDLWPWAKGTECEIVLATSTNGKEEIQLVVYNGEKVRDIVALQKPKKPERSFSPIEKR